MITEEEPIDNGQEGFADAAYMNYMELSSWLYQGMDMMNTEPMPQADGTSHSLSSACSG